MLFASYSIQLPADYDMSRIRHRVAAKAAHWDTRLGLLFKAFCVTERAEGAAHNTYAPIYVWREPMQLRAFLTGPEYASLADAFGPVPVRTAAVLDAAVDPDAEPAVVWRRRRPVRSPEDVAEVAAAARAEHVAMLAAPGTVGHVAVLDPECWVQHSYLLLAGGHRVPAAFTEGESEVASIVHLSRPQP